jgi:radical SAM protein with 4Fe4S-binding SPASM domain
MILNVQNEPTCDKRLPRLVSEAKAACPDWSVGITTNGSLLSPDMSRALAAAGLDRLVISLDAASEECYAAVHGKPRHYEKIVSNIEGAIDAGLDPRISFVVMTENAPDVFAFLKQWESRGVRYRVRVAKDRCHYFDLKRAYDYQLPPKKSCKLPFRSVGIVANGDVIPCCQDWDHEAVLGNIREQKLADIWHGATYQAFRKKLTTDSASIPLCARCGHVSNSGPGYEKMMHWAAVRGLAEAGVGGFELDTAETAGGSDAWGRRYAAASCMTAVRDGKSYVFLNYSNRPPFKRVTAAHPFEAVWLFESILRFGCWNQKAFEKRFGNNGVNADSVADELLNLGIIEAAQPARAKHAWFRG